MPACTPILPAFDLATSRVRTIAAAGFTALLLWMGAAAPARAQAFNLGLRVDLAVGTNPNMTVAADLNGDGNLDLITVNYASNTLSVQLGNGSGGFGARIDFPTAAKTDWRWAGQ